nr:retrovirus-related Pol polyprotein from transposon TNT 1-94 [Tanacetum cinerariifolium]
MREESLATWDRGNITWGGRLGGLGTVQVRWRCTGKAREGVAILVGKGVKVTVINEVNDAGTSVPTVGQISTNSTNTFSAAGLSNTVVSPTHRKSSYMDPSQYPDDPNMPALEDITYYDDEEDVGTEADFTNLETNITVSPIPTTRVHKDHHVTQIIGDLSLVTQIRSMTKVVKDQGGLTQINNKDFHTCMFACFLSQKEPKREEGIDYKEVFSPVAKIEAIRLFLAYASFMGFMVYQMDVRSALLYETIEEEVYVCQPLGFEDPYYLDKERDRADLVYQKGDILLVQVYVDDIIFCSTNKDLCKAFEKLMKDKFQMSSMGELTFFLGLQLIANNLPDQTVFGKDSSNPLMADNLPKIVRYSTHHVALMKSWLVQKQTTLGQTTTGKENSNLFMAGSLPKTISMKKVNDAMRLQALIDKKKVIITEATIREALQLDNAESIDCLPNEEIFTELSRMGCEKPSTTLTFYKRTSWNEFSSSIASAVICLSTGRKFNFSKYIFDSLARNVDSSTKFYMFARVDVDDVPAAEPSIPSPTPTTKQPPPSQELPSTSQVIPTPPPSPIAEPSSPLQQ